ncbi:unnamed protein product, partial [marine sediment metagenome]
EIITKPVEFHPGNFFRSEETGKDMIGKDMSPEDYKKKYGYYPLE